MKPARLTPAAKQDRRDEVLYYRNEAGARVAKKLVDAMQKALQALEQQPGTDSPAIGQELDIDGLRAWRLDGFPLSLSYLVLRARGARARRPPGRAAPGPRGPRGRGRLSRLSGFVGCCRLG